MSESEYLTFCPHCDCDLPARTFRNHRERFFNPVNDTWQRSISLNVVNSDDDDNDELLMEMDDGQGQSSEYLWNAAEDSSTFNVEDLLGNEIWDEVGVCDVEGDFPPNESSPNVNVHANSTCGTVSVILARCLVVLLAYFWTCFHVSDNGMEFLLAGLKRFFEIGGVSNQ